MTLYAKWSKESTKTPENSSGNNSESNQTKDPEKTGEEEPGKNNNSTTYKVTFDTDGGTKIQSQTIKKDKKINKPANPTKKGYKFIEWQLNNKTFDFNTVANKDIVLKAKWEKVSQNNANESTDTNLDSSKKIIIIISSIILILIIALIAFENIKKKHNKTELKQ